MIRRAPHQSQKAKRQQNDDPGDQPTGGHLRRSLVWPLVTGVDLEVHHGLPVRLNGPANRDKRCKAISGPDTTFVLHFFGALQVVAPLLQRYRPRWLALNEGIDDPIRPQPEGGEGAWPCPNKRSTQSRDNGRNANIWRFCPIYMHILAIVSTDTCSWVRRKPLAYLKEQ